jgi:DNA-binding MarR family transcriptional regulator
MAAATATRSAAFFIRASKVSTNSHEFSDEPAASPPYDPSMSEPEPRDVDLLQELYSTGLLVGMLVDEELAKIGVPDELFSFLGWVTRLEPVTPGALAAETGLPPTTIRDYIRRLIASGDVRKVPNPADGRSYHLVLTPKGRRVAVQGWPAVVAAFERVERHLQGPARVHLSAMRELREAVRLALAESQAGRGAPAPQGARSTR